MKKLLKKATGFLYDTGILFPPPHSEIPARKFFPPDRESTDNAKTSEIKSILGDRTISQAERHKSLCDLLGVPYPKSLKTNGNSNRGKSKVRR